MAEISLIDGWLPIVLQVLAAIAVLAAIGWRTRMWVPSRAAIAVLAGLVVVGAAYWFYRHQALGEGSGASPVLMWVWIALIGVSLAIAVLGWPGAPWWRRVIALLAVPLTVLCAAVTVNVWTGYLPTVGAVWNRTTGAALPTQVDLATALQMQRDGDRPEHGLLVAITTPAEPSGFAHRDELVYLPPAWFANPRPALPAVLMLGGEFGHPSDWPTTGSAQATADEFAAGHDGYAPILVFADTSGTFSNDTECVNGVRGNAADHLTEAVVPYVISTFGASADPAQWGIAGWSSGGMCALMTTVMHPELFTAFVDIDGLMGPSAGSKQQTIARLFGGDAQAWESFDPATVMTRRSPYPPGLAGWFSIVGDGPPVYRPAGAPAPEPVARDHFNPADGDGIANYLCGVAAAAGIECSVVPQPGEHDFPTAGAVFATALPWLAGRLGTPGVPVAPLPGAP